MLNRIGDPKAQPVIADLKRRLAALRQKYHDTDGPVVN